MFVSNKYTQIVIHKWELLWAKTLSMFGSLANPGTQVLNECFITCSFFVNKDIPISIIMFVDCIVFHYMLLGKIEGKRRRGSRD